MDSSDLILCEIRLFGFDFAPKGWLPCNGQILQIAQNQGLFVYFGTYFGGDGVKTFGLPDLRSRVVVGNGDGYSDFSKGGEEQHTLTKGEMPQHGHQTVASSNDGDTIDPTGHFWPSNTGYASKSEFGMHESSIGTAGKDLPHPNMSPYLSLNYCIAVQGRGSSRDGSSVTDYTGAIQAFTWKVWPGDYWFPCDGRQLLVRQFTELFSVIGYAFGGQGEYFALPDLRGRSTVAAGAPSGLTSYQRGDKAGVKEVTLTIDQMPAHSHEALAKKLGSSQTPEKNVWANDNLPSKPKCFSTAKGNGQKMYEWALGMEGESKAHNNMMPYQAMEFMICVKGISPHG